MNKEDIYILIDIIARNGSIKRLARKGVDYNQIASMTNSLVKDGLIASTNDKIILTEKGNEVYQKLGIEYKRTNKDEWIEKDKRNQIAQIDKNFIFVPRQDELTF